MTATTMERINRLSVERSRLYRLASGDRLGDPHVRRRIHEVTRELDLLWDQRRQERAGHSEGIDLLVDRVYERIYGRDFDEAVAPLRVGSGEEEAATLAA